MVSAAPCVKLDQAHIAEKLTHVAVARRGLARRWVCMWVCARVCALVGGTRVVDGLLGGDGGAL